MDRAKLQKLVKLVESARLETRWILLGVGVSAVLVYLNTLGNGFVFDDWQQIVDNPFLRRPDGLVKIFTTGVWQFLGQVGVSNFYRPLMHALFYADFRAFGLNPAGYHAVSIVLHALVSLLVYLLVFRLSRDRVTSAFAALLFAVHPVHTEAVAWISAYPELLCALFSLLAMWLYLRWRSIVRADTGASPRRAVVALAATGPLLFLALLAKEIAIAVPLLLAVYELLRRADPRRERPDPGGVSERAPSGQGGALPRNRSSAAADSPFLHPKTQTTRFGDPGLAGRASVGTGQGNQGAAPAGKRSGAPVRPLLERVWPAYVSMAAAVIFYLAARLHALGALFPAKTRLLPLGEHFWTACAVFWRYFQVQILPARLHAFYYMEPSRGPADPAVLAGIVLAAALLAAFWWLQRKGRVEAWAVALYLLPLAPALMLPYAPIKVLMAERYVYLSSVALCWAAGAGLAAAIRRWGYRRSSTAFILIFVAFSARTVVRNTDWRDEIAFYRKTIADFPGFPRAYLNLGEALMRRERLAEAREVTETAARLDPNYPDPHVNLGLICREGGDLEAAASHLQRAVLLGRQQGNRYVVSRALTNLAVTYRAAGRLPESLAASEQALEVDPLFPGAHNNLAYALLQQGRADEAIAHLARAIELDPTLDVAWSNLGLAYAMKGDPEKALELFRRAERLNSANGETHARAAEVLLQMGRVQEGIRELSSALLLDPQNARARQLRPPTATPDQQ